MRILYIHAYALDNGMANCVQVLSMCKEFSKDHDVYLLSPQSEKNESEMEDENG